MSILTRTALAALFIGAAVGSVQAQTTRQIQVLPAPGAEQQAALAPNAGPSLASTTSTPAPAAVIAAPAPAADPNPAPAAAADAPPPAATADATPAEEPAVAPVAPAAPKVVAVTPAPVVVVKPAVREHYGRYGYREYAEAPRYRQGGYGGYGHSYGGGYRAERCH